MAQDLYADQVANIRDKLAQLQQEKIESYDDLANSITDQYNEKMAEYGEKWKSVMDAGEGEIGALATLKGGYAGVKKLRDLYKGVKERKAARRAKQQEKDVGEDDDFDEDAEPLDGGVSRTVAGDESGEPIDFVNDDGQTYFTGSEADHEQYYNEDGTLKDPSNVPEGHRATNQQDGEDEDPFEGIDEDDPELQQMFSKSGNPDPQTQALEGGQDAAGTSHVDSSIPEEADEPAYSNPFDPIAKPPGPEPQPSAGEAPSEDVVSESTTTFTQARPQETQFFKIGDDPEAFQFQPTAGQSIRSEVRLTQRVPGDEPVQQPPSDPVELQTFKTNAPADIDTPADTSGAAQQAPPRPADAAPAPEAPQPAVIGGEQSEVQTALQTGEEGGESLLKRAGQKAFQSLAQRGQSIRQGFSKVKNFFSSSAEGAEAGSEAATAGAEAGAEGAAAGVEAGLGTADAVLGAVPVLGELALAVSGFVAIGEGLYHLFHPEKKPPPPPTASPVLAPHGLTQKYALALPSGLTDWDFEATYWAAG